jgi:hypothetical protein
MIVTQKPHIRPSLLDSLDRLEETHTSENQIYRSGGASILSFGFFGLRRLFSKAHIKPAAYIRVLSIAPTQRL